ncbi:UvrD-helicase domain-containing protein [Sediminicola luteus]|uniref:DNA 3'-5' helicase n=1 Tax=Sediminicola luteus TaxID=319238 RepID=A0A2A4G8N8_9FLAO|nr:UvrD-helicase domain-containing protein [Sediminicola luteus]PCE64987.1 hypothetical protein B7P33_07460 [Sediminicola luteus]
MDLDENRRKIIRSNSNILVIGGPGSGKTTIALLKCFDFIKEKKLNRGQQVLFLSFSRNAKARVIESASSFEEYVELKNKIVVQTFHGFFLDIVKDYGYLLGARKKISIIPPHDEAILRRGREENSPDWLSELENNFVEEGKIVFDLFAPKALSVLKRSRRILKLLSNRFPLVIVDEAQDTGSTQWEIVQCFSKYSQLLLLADLKQQIYDYRPDVSIERINEIREVLRPVEYNLEGDNFRSPNTEILQFALDMYERKDIKRTYNGVEIFGYRNQLGYKQRALKRALGQTFKTIKEATGESPKSVAILCTRNKGVKSVSKILNEAGISHKYQFDEIATNISSRLVACLLEPVMDEQQHLIFCLFIVREFYSSKGKSKDVDKVDRWINDVKEGKRIRGTFVSSLSRVISQIKLVRFSGNPAKDWRNIQSILVDSNNNNELIRIAKYSENLVAFNRGKKIMEGLTRAWDQMRGYIDARGVLQNALIETQISNTTPKENGINVMNMHQSKGKEFDSVIIYQNDYECSFELRDERNNQEKIRKLLFVGSTRAKQHLQIVIQFGANISMIQNLKTA